MNRLSADGLMKALLLAEAGHLARPDHQEPTFRCAECCDTGFLTRTDSYGRVYGRKCLCLVEAIQNKQRTESSRFKGRDVPIDNGEGIPF